MAMSGQVEQGILNDEVTIPSIYCIEYSIFALNHFKLYIIKLHKKLGSENDSNHGKHYY